MFAALIFSSGNIQLGLGSNTKTEKMIRENFLLTFLYLFSYYHLFLLTFGELAAAVGADCGRVTSPLPQRLQPIKRRRLTRATQLVDFELLQRK